MRRAGLRPGVRRGREIVSGHRDPRPHRGADHRRVPGDGKPKPVAFPDPAVVAVQGEDFRFIRLESLLELKLASGLTAPHRLRDLADVQDLIIAAKLPRDLASSLDPSVRDEYLRLWEIAQTVPPTE